MSDEEAIKTTKALIEWARERWGVEKEVRYICPACGAHSDSESYCTNDGRSLKKTIVESEGQDWRNNLQDLIYGPDYMLAPPQEAQE